MQLSRVETEYVWDAAQALYNMGNLLHGMGQWSAAVACYDRLLAATSPGHWRACLFKASALIRLEDPHEALATLLAAADLPGGAVSHPCENRTQASLHTDNNVGE